MKNLRDTPLTLITIRDLVTTQKDDPPPPIILTKKAYDNTSGSVIDYARRCKVKVIVVKVIKEI